MGDRDFRLVQLDLPERLEFSLAEGTTRIGRASSNTIVLRDSAVSRFHCYLVREGAEVKVFDGGSRNPARVDGAVAAGQPLLPGQVLLVGRCRLVLEAPGEPAPLPLSEGLGAPPEGSRAADPE